MKKDIHIILVFVIVLIVNACDSGKCDSVNINYNLSSTLEIFVTSESGDKIAGKEKVSFKRGKPNGSIIQIFPEKLKQNIEGIGTSFTESSAFVLAHLEKAKRQQVMKNIYSENGANFSLARTHIGACDFCIEGKYSYADKAGDIELTEFSLEPDKEGFKKTNYPGIVDETYDLLPMIKEALQIKNNQTDKELKIIASAWTAPVWMKNIEDWYIPGTAENDWQGTGGVLKEKYVSTYVDYLAKYIDAYGKEGVNIWGLTPVNEPEGNGGNWESMHFTPQTQNEFIKTHLGPKLKASGHDGIKLFVYDQNRDHLQQWTDVLFGDTETSQFIYGAAIHWYASTYKVYENILEQVHNKFPGFSILHTEGCIDNLGREASEGITDPERYKESGWFDNDDFWWNPNATDWAYSAIWAPHNEDHPVYTPVHRYARNIIVSIDHWVEGWIDWNIVLDRNGGPNHVGNFCGAPIMIDTDSKYVYYTPIYYVLAQFSKTIRPGDKAVQTNRQLVDLDTDALHACATINKNNLLSVQLLNTTKKPIEYSLQVGEQFTKVTIPANSVQTVRIQL